MSFVDLFGLDLGLICDDLRLVDPVEGLPDLTWDHMVLTWELSISLGLC